MKSLFLLRHAKSSWNQDGIPDFDRPLNDRGRRDAPIMGRILRDSGITPEQIVSSPAKRARKTAQIVATELGYPEESILFEPRMYGAFPEILFAIMGELDDSFDRVMLVGHNPGISQFAERLSTEYLGDFPTCALARLDFSVSSWRSIVPRTGFPGLFEYPKKRNTPRKEAPE